MKYSDEYYHPFIIRIWKEEREVQGTSPAWRGFIEHAPSGKGKYFQDLGSIISFILPYFDEMGIKPGDF